MQRLHLVLITIFWLKSLEFEQHHLEHDNYAYDKATHQIF